MRRIVYSAFALALVPFSAFPQNAETLARLVARCGSGECQNALSATFASMDLNPSTNAELDEELAAIALTLYSVARTADDPDIEERVASALYTLSSVAVDETQSTIFTEVADAIMEGDTALYDTEDPFSASPS